MLDGAVAVFCAVGGVEPQSETVWRQADKYRVPRIAFVNKMDRVGADFERVVGEIRDKLKAKPLLLQLPIGAEEKFTGVIDLVEKRALIWDEDRLGANYRVEEIPADLQGAARDAYREKMIETLADHDERIMEMYLDGKERRSPEQLRKAVRVATLKIEVIPVLMGSAFRNKGVQPMLDAVVDYLPSPLDVPPVMGKVGDKMEERWPRDDAPFSALAFKIMTDPYVGTLTFLRVYSGRLESGIVGAQLDQAASANGSDGWSRCTPTSARRLPRSSPATSARSGCATRLPATRCATRRIRSCSSRSSFPIRSSRSRSSPRPRPTRTAWARRCRSSRSEDPSFRVSVNRETAQTLISGMGELHLEIIVDRMLREFKVDANVGKPQVAYRETIRKPAEAEGRFVRQTGGHGQFGVVELRIEPLAKGGGFEFVDATKGGSIPRNFIPSIEDGREGGDGDRGAGRLSDGRRAGARCSTASTTRSIRRNSRSRSRARWLSRRRCEKADPVLLEPVMEVEVVTPQEFMGEVIGDLNARRGKIQRHGEPRRRAGDRGARAAGDDVRLRDPAALDDAGTRDLHDAVRASTNRCRRTYTKN